MGLSQIVVPLPLIQNHVRIVHMPKLSACNQKAAANMQVWQPTQTLATTSGQTLETNSNQTLATTGSHLFFPLPRFELLDTYMSFSKNFLHSFFQRFLYVHVLFQELFSKLYPLVTSWCFFSKKPPFQNCSFPRTKFLPGNILSQGQTRAPSQAHLYCSRSLSLISKASALVK